MENIPATKITAQGQCQTYKLNERGIKYQVYEVKQMEIVSTVGTQKNSAGICAAFLNVIIQQYSHYNINTAGLVAGSNIPDILYSYFVIYNRGTSRKFDNRGATALCLNYKTVKINIFPKSFCYNILLNLYILYLCIYIYTKSNNI